MDEESKDGLISISLRITPEQREWLESETFRRSSPGNMSTMSIVIRRLIDEARQMEQREPSDDA